MENDSSSSEEFILSRGYRLLKPIGRGSYATVLLCQSKAGKLAACKVIDVSNSSNQYATKFLPRELEIIGSLRHDNVIEIYDIFKFPDKYFIFMRFAESRDLLEHIADKGPVVEERVRFWAWQLASALTYMHSLRIVHRDLKCENILITAHYNIKITDFGFSKILDKEDTPSQTWCGSIGYAAPEILEAKPYNAKKVDSWALGVVLYAAMSGFLPFREKTPRATLASQKRRLQLEGGPWRYVTAQAKLCLIRLLQLNAKLRWSPENLLKSTWVSEDPRLTEFSPAEVPRQVPIDSRRLVYQLRDRSDQLINSSPLSSVSARQSFDLLNLPGSLNYCRNNDSGNSNDLPLEDSCKGNIFFYKH